MPFYLYTIYMCNKLFYIKLCYCAAQRPVAVSLKCDMIHCACPNPFALRHYLYWGNNQGWRQVTYKRHVRQSFRHRRKVYKRLHLPTSSVVGNVHLTQRQYILTSYTKTSKMSISSLENSPIQAVRSTGSVSDLDQETHSPGSSCSGDHAPPTDRPERMREWIIR